jgi:hypothetical protein
MDNHEAVFPESLQEIFDDRDDFSERGHIVAEGFAKAAGLDEITLHVDDDQRHAIPIGDFKIKRLSGDGDHGSSFKRLLLFED